MSKSCKGLAWYLFITFAMAWILWEIPIRMGMSLQNPLFQLIAVPGTFSPAVAALVVRKWITREGFADAGLRVNLHQWRYYLVAWFLPLAVALIILILASCLGLSEPDYSLLRFAKYCMGGLELPSPPAYIWAVIPVQLLIGALLGTPLLWGEEFGWRSYLQLRLFEGRPLLAAIITGLIWGVWHYPLNLRGYNYPDDRILGLMVFPVGTILLSIIFGWLRQRTGSIWAASLAHSATNSIGGSLMILLFGGGSNWIFISYLGILGWIPLGALCVWIILTGQLKGESTNSFEGVIR
jgi:membrane protease YdiL (CAAX protease family)